MLAVLDQHRPQIEALCRKFQVRRLDVFGSAATGSRFDPQTSDVDFLVEFEPDAEPQVAALYLDLIAALRSLLGREVDVVMARAVRDPYLRQSIETSRSTLYAAA